MDHVAQYSSSSSSEDESQRCPRPSKKPRIPFPTALLGDPPPVAQGAPDERDALGRVRAFPHAAGNWATHLFIQACITVGHLEDVQDAAAQVIESARALGTGDQHHEIHGIDEASIHVSVSRTVVLRYHQIDKFIASARKALANKKPFTMAVTPKVAYFANDNGTRSFLSLEVSEGHAQLADLVLTIDSLLAEVSQPAFYKPPQFHASVCWWADGELMTAAQLARVQERVDAAGLDDACMPVGAVRCKLGDKMYDIQLG